MTLDEQLAILRATVEMSSLGTWCPSELLVEEE